MGDDRQGNRLFKPQKYPVSVANKKEKQAGR
jgi:hypothetical protein